MGRIRRMQMMPLVAVYRRIDTMIPVDRTSSFPYRTDVMMKGSIFLNRLFGWSGMIAATLAIVLPFCLVAGAVAGEDSCQDLGSPPGLCSTVTSHADHLLAVPAPLIILDPIQQISMPVTISLEPAFSSVGHFSIPDGRAPPLA